MARQLVSGDEAATCPKQPAAACADCPWSRKSLPGWLGTLDVVAWLEVAHGESTADCHALKGPDGEPWACAGLAVYQANVGKVPRDPGALRLDADRGSVFATPMEFEEHHRKA